MNNTEFLKLKNAKDLFKFIENVYSDYNHEPTETQLLTLIFSLNHLRDWIAEGKGWEDIKKIPRVQRDAGQLFYEDIDNAADTSSVVRLTSCKYENYG